MTTHTEQVLCIARALVPGGLDWRGVRRIRLDEHIEAIQAEGEFRPRDEVEDDPSWKQVIPYLLLRDGERVFLMKRTKAGADQRLHDRFSIGVGGHVNPGDADLYGGLRREWAEELTADFTPDFEPIGVLNDDENDVGAVHLGLVFEADARGRPVAIRETDKLSGAFATFSEVAEVQDRLETWSALLFDFLGQR